MRLNRVGLRVFVIGLVVAGAVSTAGGAAGTAPLAEAIRKLASAPGLKEMRVGIRVVSLGPESHVVYEQNSAQPFKPASNQKIVTSAAALAVLPADFTFRTVLARRGDDLVIVGSGDPSMGDRRMAEAAKESIYAVFHRWADQLEAAGLTTIKGSLLFDDFIFDDQYVHPSWRGQHSPEKWYSAPVGGLNFNDNCVDVVIRPAGQKGEPAIVTLVPNTPWVQLENTSKTASKGEPLVRLLGTGPITVSVSGSVSKPNDPDSPLSIAVVDPGSFFASCCRTVLATRGIKIMGETRRQRVRLADGTLPAEIKVVATHERKLIDLLGRMNKSSMNMFAEALLKTSGAYAGGDNSPRVGSYQTGRAVVARFLNQLGIPGDGYVIDDGSGLSHNNRATPAMITTILVYMDRHALGQQWWSSLAVPGEKVGTLRRRMTDLAGKVFAKTGYVNGASALSGYVLGPGGRRYAFSILCNDTGKAKGGLAAARELEDGICRTLATWPPTATAKGG